MQGARNQAFNRLQSLVGFADQFRQPRQRWGFLDGLMQCDGGGKTSVVIHGKRASLSERRHKLMDKAFDYLGGDLAVLQDQNRPDF